MIINVPSTLTAKITNSVQLDQIQYTLTIYYQPFGQRYYFIVNDYAGNVIMNMPLVDSLPNLLKGWFTQSTMTYSSVDQVVTILP